MLPCRRAADVFDAAQFFTFLFVVGWMICSGLIASKLLLPPQDKLTGIDNIEFLCVVSRVQASKPRVSIS